MPRLALRSDEFFSRRTDRIRELLVATAADPEHLHIQPHRHSVGQIISVSDHFSEKLPPQDQLFATSSRQLYAQYYEIWRFDAKQRYVHLYQTYFHLYAIPSRNERDQLFCLHAEPEEPIDEIQGRLKATPHIHVKSKESRLLPIAKAHLPGCYAAPDRVLRSLADFDTAFADTIAIVKHEVINRY
ncbi:MAG TPA: hypothetical protein VEI07_20320 [Planctomycetaceae bacterium]|nr:hypothetical protein [Planctomycetaceae bacterium]